MVLVVLGQGYDEGWRAYQLPVTSYQEQDIRNQLAVWLPWFYGEKLEQVKFNGWGNGFIVTSNQRPETSQQLVIVYWPQYLQWGGLALLVGVVGVLGLGSIRRR